MRGSDSALTCGFGKDRQLSLLFHIDLPAHMASDLRFRTLDRPSGRGYIPPRSEQPERLSQGTEWRPLGKP